MKKLLRLALLLAVVLPFAVLQAGPKADADLAAIADHFTKTSAAFNQSKSNWRWVFYGDSITHGCAHTQGWRNFVEIFAERIRWEKAALFDTVINSGNSGYSSTHLVDPGQYDWQVASLKPNVVLILIGVNDIVLPDASLPRFRQNLVTLVQWVRRDGAIPVLQTYSTVKLFRNPTAKWQHDYVKRYNEQDAYNQTIREVAAQEDVILVDHAKYWQEHASDPAILNFWLAEHLHPGARGHQEMARLIIRTLGLDGGSACLALEAGGKQPEGVADIAAVAKDEQAAWSIDDDATAIAAGGNWSLTGGAAQAGDVVRLPMTDAKANINLQDGGKLAGYAQEVCFEAEMRFMPDALPTRGNRLYVGVGAGAGAAYTEGILLLDAGNVRGTLGNAEMPIELGKFFTLRMRLDLATQETTLYIDGQPVCKAKGQIYGKGRLYINMGFGSPSISGTTEIRRLRVSGK